MLNRLSPFRLFRTESGAPTRFQRAVSQVSSLSLALSMMPGAVRSESVPGFSHPVSAGALPFEANGTRVVTLNTASGAKAVYLTPFNRTRQASLVADMNPDVAGFQEVDTDVARTGFVNTALEVTRQVNPALNVFVTDKNVPHVSMDAEAPATAIRSGSDGTTVYQTPHGTLVEGRSFAGNERAGGIHGDTSPDAHFGIPLYLGPQMHLEDAYTVVLPSLPDGGPTVASQALLDALAQGPVSAQTREALAQVNEPARVHAPNEPRIALVVRATDANGVSRTFINTHPTNGDDPNHAAGPRESLRETELAELARIVKAEQAQRQVVLLGDFNDSAKNVGDVMTPVGLKRLVGGSSSGIGNYDQIWATRDVQAVDNAQVNTRLVTDHPHAGYTVIEDSEAASGA